MESKIHDPERSEEAAPKLEQSLHSRQAPLDGLSFQQLELSGSPRILWQLLGAGSGYLILVSPATASIKGIIRPGG